MRNLNAKSLHSAEEVSHWSATKHHSAKEDHYNRDNDHDSDDAPKNRKDKRQQRTIQRYQRSGWRQHNNLNMSRFQWPCTAKWGSRIAAINSDASADTDDAATAEALSGKAS